MIFTRPFWSALAAMAGIIVVSNVLADIFFSVPGTGEQVRLPWATLTFPVAYLITDLINRFFGAGEARKLVALGFLLAVPVSIVAGLLTGKDMTTAVRIGLASGLAFILGEMLDISVFSALRRSAWWIAPLVSSLFANALDTAVFYTAAFAALPLINLAGADWPWAQIACWDFLFKMLVTFCLLLPFRLAISPSKNLA